MKVRITMIVIFSILSSCLLAQNEFLQLSIDEMYSRSQFENVLFDSRTNSFIPKTNLEQIESVFDFKFLEVWLNSSKNELKISVIINKANRPESLVYFGLGNDLVEHKIGAMGILDSAYANEGVLLNIGHVTKQLRYLYIFTDGMLVMKTDVFGLLNVKKNKLKSVSTIPFNYWISINGSEKELRQEFLEKIVHTLKVSSMDNTNKLTIVEFKLKMTNVDNEKIILFSNCSRLTSNMTKRLSELEPSTNVEFFDIKVFDGKHYYFLPSVFFRLV